MLIEGEQNLYRTELFVKILEDIVMTIWLALRCLRARIIVCSQPVGRPLTEVCHNI